MSDIQRFHSEWCDRMNGGPECNCEAGDSIPGAEGMSEREKRIRIHCSSERFNVSAVDVLYLLGVIDVIRGDRQRLRKSLDESGAQVVESQKAYNHQAHCAHLLSNQLNQLKSAVDTIPAAVMLAGGPPYKLTFTEACLREIMESQK